MKVVLISGHDGASDRKTGFHFWAEIMAARGIGVDFVTVGSSYASLLKKNGKQLKKPFNQWIPLYDRVRKFTWMPLFHPMNFGNKLLNYLSWPVLHFYPFLLPRVLLDEIRDADLFVVESGSGPMLVPKLAKLCPKAKFIYNFSDRFNVVQYHPIIPHSDKYALAHFSMVRLNAADVKDAFPANAPVVYIPQAIDKALFDKPCANPYTGPRNAISIGDMLFDGDTIRDLAAAYPDWTFHLFGKGARLETPMPNVKEYGEYPFDALVPYLKHADIGLAPYRYGPDREYLSQSSLKLVQYTYCRLPIVAPDFAAMGRDHAFSYSPAGKSAVEAFGEAISYDRNRIDVSSVVGWEDMVDRYLAVAA